MAEAFGFYRFFYVTIANSSIHTIPILCARAYNRITFVCTAELPIESKKIQSPKAIIQKKENVLIAERFNS